MTHSAHDCHHHDVRQKKHCHLYVRHDSFICVTWLIQQHDCHVQDVRHKKHRHLYVRHDSFVCVTWHIQQHDCHVHDVRHKKHRHLYVRHDSLICATRHIQQHYCHVHDVRNKNTVTCMCDVTHSYVWRDTFICVHWISCTRCTTQKTPPLVCVTWLIRMCDAKHSFVCIDSDIHIIPYKRHPTTYMCDVTHLIQYKRHPCHLYAWRDSFICVTQHIWLCVLTRHIHVIQYKRHPRHLCVW